MNPLPDPNFLPAPLWLVTVLHLLTLSLHFAAMNFLVGGLLIVVFGRLADKWRHPVVAQFVKLFPTAMAATVTLGVAPLLFVQLVYPVPVYSAAIVTAWFFLGIVGAVMVAYYLLYAAAFGAPGSPRRPAFLTAALLLLAYVAFAYSNLFSIAERPGLAAVLYAGDPSGLRVNPHLGQWLWRWLHMLLGAVTIGGFFIGLLGRRHEDAFALGRNFFLWGMVGAMAVGLVYLLSLADILKPFMHTPAIWWLSASIILSLGSLHFFFTRKFFGAGAMLFVSLLGMVVVRHNVRLLQLEGHFDPAAWPIRPQWDVFLVFLVCFVLALGLVWYMLRLFFARPSPGASARDA
ncbi:MAG TPA: hypothetical protein PK112_01635 [candidate division Zixibacteria bacterium]|nr:hypothetical protein [candidate division Zixibacteria bacterium]